MRKSGSLIYLLGSVGLILLAILLTALIQRAKDTSSTGADIRARAGNPSTLQMTGQVESVDNNKEVFVVDNLKFSDGSEQDLGKWTVTPGPNADISKLTSGRTVVLGVEAATFSIEKHTFRALEVRQLR